MTFDVTIPVLNEEESLAQQVGIVHAFLTRHYPAHGQWRIVIADNGSTDNTPEIARKLENALPGVHVLKIPKRGVGLALKTSWTASTADMVGYMDLDLATDLHHFPEAYHALAEGGADLVYGTRLHPKSKVIGRTVKREITSRAFNTILKVYLGTRFSDGMCGFKWVKRCHLPLLMEHGAQSDGWFFSTELLAAAEWNGLNVKELPVQWTDDAANSKVDILRLAKQYLQAMKVLKKHKPCKM